MAEESEVTTQDQSGQISPLIPIGLGLAVAFLLYTVVRSHQQANSTASAQTSNTGKSSYLGNAPYVAHTDEFVTTNAISDSYNTGIGAGAQAPVTNNQTTFVPSAAPPNQGDPPRQVDPPKKPTPIKAPQKGYKGTWTCRYTVQSGDTLTAIGEMYSTTWQAIYGHNLRTIDSIALLMHNVIPGGNWNNIRPGEVLIVPCK